MADATLYLLKREPGSEGWVPDGEPVFSEGDLASSGEEKARAYGEDWVRADPKNRRFEIESH